MAKANDNPKVKPLSEQLRLFLIEKHLGSDDGYGFLWSLVGHLMAIERGEKWLKKMHKKEKARKKS